MVQCMKELVCPLAVEIGLVRQYSWMDKKKGGEGMEIRWNALLPPRGWQKGWMDTPLKAALSYNEHKKRRCSNPQKKKKKGGQG